LELHTPLTAPVISRFATRTAAGYFRRPPDSNRCAVILALTGRLGHVIRPADLLTACLLHMPALICGSLQWSQPCKESCGKRARRYRRISLSIQNGEIMMTELGR